MFKLIQTAQAFTLPFIEGTSDQNLGEFIGSLYTIAIGIVGLAVFIQFLHAGILYLLAAGNITKSDQAKQIMQNAVLGAVLLLSSYLILNVINPDLVKTNLFKFPEIKKPTPYVRPPGPPVINDAVLTDMNYVRGALNSLGIDHSDISLEGITRYTLTSIQTVARGCECGEKMKIVNFISSSNTFFINLEPESYAEQHLIQYFGRERMKKIAGEGNFYYPQATSVYEDNLGGRYTYLEQNQWRFDFRRVSS